MTPGFAKSRKVLFYLPYPEPDRVIINAHNFTQSAPVPIGTEIGWWCPSLDSDGNGTTTLTDLVATTGNGTLTGMDASTDWVADTGSGGVRALDFVAATQQYVHIAKPTMSGGKFSLSLWGKPTLDISARVSAIWTQDFSGATSGFSFFCSGSRMRGLKGSPVAAATDSATAISLNTWYHWCLTFNGSTLRLYRNGTLAASTLSSGLTYPSSGGFAIGSAIPKPVVVKRELLSPFPAK